MGLFVACMVLAALVLGAVIGGIVLAWRRGRVLTSPAMDEVVEPHRLGAEALGESATLLQFSTRSCTRCPGVHRVLADVARDRSGVLHLDVDVTHRPDIARHFRVMQTPTTLVLDRHGMVQTRFGGTPGRSVVELELARLTAQAHAE
ncbi:thiol-disulfide isomerase [Microbacterium mangrovi]|uniref:Thiol-disulfide isomerase n=1 Tax=Microbacterium mangrovi TaxID=1348253 RepID=A0A0B1ZZK4_9MICO|nr:thioredoxin family protein [Microbacterium mangrovi]KHK96176.1 thiol-disulfide isomerase [Microbacterium mangrovi]